MCFDNQDNRHDKGKGHEDKEDKGWFRKESRLVILREVIRVEESHDLNSNILYSNW